MVDDGRCIPHHWGIWTDFPYVAAGQHLVRYYNILAKDLLSMELCVEPQKLHPVLAEALRIWVYGCVNFSFTNPQVRHDRKFWGYWVNIGQSHVLEYKNNWMLQYKVVPPSTYVSAFMFTPKKKCGSICYAVDREAGNPMIRDSPT